MVGIFLKSKTVNANSITDMDMMNARSQASMAAQLQRIGLAKRKKVITLSKNGQKYLEQMIIEMEKQMKIYEKQLPNLFQFFAYMKKELNVVKGKKREKLLNEIKEGLVDIVIGTHSLIEEDVVFKNLGLIVIDEQHKFGVRQRKLLRDKGNLANLIVMSATPIPRSLALTIYGDLDVSIIDELPSGRSPIKTKWIKDEIEKRKMYDFIDRMIEKGRQVYIVSPLIEESETLNVKSAQETFEEYKDIFPNRRIDIIHGRQKYKEKQEVMEKFKNHKIDILVSTTVIEVGVNVPNATVMVIRDAQRFGLSSLHQLRGRVGRGSHKSYCFLESQTNNEVSARRLEVMESTTDGFKIAEEDLKLRNSGEILGIKQSGVSDMVFTDIVRNVKEIKKVHDFVIWYLEKNNGQIENEFLKMDIYKKFFHAE